MGRAEPLAVLRPRTPEEVARAMAGLNRLSQTVVPQGGLTGLAGGANPRPQDVALSLAGLSGVIDIDRDARSMTCLAGTPLAEAQAAAAAEGLMLPIDLGARDSCLIGGNIATNAGGLRVIRYGTTRANVLGLEAVLADGSTIGALRKMIKISLGPDLSALMIGSEGTIGTITRAVLRLVPQPAGRLTALCALSDFPAVLRLLTRARDTLPGLSAFEAMWASFFRLMSEMRGSTLFADAPPLAVIIEAETDGSDAERLRFEALLEAAIEAGEITDAILPQSLRELSAMWSVRETAGMEQAMPGLVNLDISLPSTDLGRFDEAAADALRSALPGAATFSFGHVGDGNLHLCVHLPGTDPEAAIHEVDDVIYPLVGRMGGAISAEHGIGTLKRDYLGQSRTAADLAALRRVKAALDPNGILNPGKVLPL
ncbi:FAD-binding oxidoreductase [Paracoccus suum]|uniref:FAD-binding oxidoreductase n=2 Tax=Paracoccus suum TaxID=2259340 RepID=A0A344PP62_9RHOB|nr:FAD-binding oxidoreductase [Paracoccus suum]